MTPAHFYFNLFVLLYSMCQLYPQVSAITAPQKRRTKEEKKITLCKFFQRSRKELSQSTPRKISPVLTGPNCVICPFLDRLLAKDIGLPLFPLGLPLELKHMGSVGEGLTPPKNWASVRMAKASNRHCLATVISLQSYTLSLQSHVIRAGEGQAGSQL